MQAQTIANMEFIRECDAEEHRLRRAKMAALTSDPAAWRAYLLRQSMIESVRAAAQEEAQPAAT